MREIRTELDDKDEQNEPEEDQIDFKKAGIAVVLFVLTMLLGYLAIQFIDYLDNRSQLLLTMRSIESISKNLNTTNAIPLSVLENYEFDLNKMMSELSGNKKIKKAIEENLAILNNHLAYVPSGTNIYSWATTELFRSEIDTLQVPYKERANYSVKPEYLPITANEKRAYAILQAHPVWGKDECISIATGQIWIGMTKEQLTLAKGQPRHIDKNYSSNTNSEQWAYGNIGPYYYLENGILVTIQD